MIKAIFFDIDGTLVSFATHAVPASTREGLERLRRCGVKLFVATGRHRLSIDNLGGLVFDGYITLNGQYCFKADGEVIRRHTIVADDMRHTLEQLHDDPFACLFMEDDRLYINYIDQPVRDAQRLINFPDPPLVDPVESLSHDVFQLMAFVGPEREKSLMKALPHCESTRWNPYFIDVVPRSGSKHVGIDAVCQAYGIDLSETMAFGDGQNDCEMLRHVAVGVAMGNASEQVQQAADWVTSSVDEDGVARALQHFDLWK